MELMRLLQQISESMPVWKIRLQTILPYLLGAKNGKSLRYKGIKGMTDYRAVAQLIKEGGYATSLSYVDNLCNIINLTILVIFEYSLDNRIILDYLQVYSR